MEEKGKWNRKGKGMKAARKRKNIPDWEKRANKKIDILVMLLAGLVLAASVLLELRDRKREEGTENGDR